MSATPWSSIAAFSAALVVLLSASAGICAAGAVESATALKQVASIELPGPPGKRFGYLTIDYEDGWLFAGHMAANQIYVIDLRNNHVLHVVTDTPGVKGLEFVPDERKVYTSNASDETVGILDVKTMKVVRKISTEAPPNGSAYAAPQHKLYVSSERIGAIAIIDVQTNKILTTLRFNSGTGDVRYGANTKLVYVSLPDSSEVVAIDPVGDTVVGRYPVDGCRGNHGMALDEARHRAFLVCRGNNRLAVFNLDTRKVIASLSLPIAPDVAEFDPGLGRVYVGCSSGAISVFQEDDPDHFRKLADVAVPHRTHSLAVDTETHRLYVPEQEEDGHKVARILVFDAASP